MVLDTSVTGDLVTNVQEIIRLQHAEEWATEQAKGQLAADLDANRWEQAERVHHGVQDARVRTHPSPHDSNAAGVVAARCVAALASTNYVRA